MHSPVKNPWVHDGPLPLRLEWAIVGGWSLVAGIGLYWLGRAVIGLAHWLGALL
jgi:hypothetical protein